MIKREISDEEFMEVASHMAATDERLKPYMEDFGTFLYTGLYTSMLCAKLFPDASVEVEYEELFNFKKGNVRYVVARGGKHTPVGLVRVMIYHNGEYSTHHDYPSVVAALADILRHI